MLGPSLIWSAFKAMSTAAAELPNEPILLREVKGPVVTLTLNRPRQYNALSEAMLVAIQEALDEIAADDRLRVLVLAANGKAFCAGHDLKEMRARPDQDYYQELFARCSRMMLTLTAIPQAVIAKVHGIATAAGCQLVAASDLAIAAETARFATSGINFGLFCSTPAVALTRNVGRKRSFEMLMTGDFIDAQTAADYGLINRAVPDEALDDAVAELAGRITDRAPVAVRTGKQLFYQQLETDSRSAYALAGETMACNMMAEDTNEGIDAFIEKRPPPRWQKD